MAGLRLRVLQQKVSLGSSHFRMSRNYAQLRCNVSPLTLHGQREPKE